MTLRLPTDNESADFVMPAGIAGIQVCRMRPETSMSTWVPALHAGTTKSSGVFSEVPQRRIFKGGARRKKNLAAKSSNDAKDVGAGFEPALLRGLIKVLSLENKKGESL